MLSLWAKLAARLVEAAGSRIEEVRVTRLLDTVFYANVLVRGPAGAAEVDARPSDAVNLALAAGVPVKVDTELFCSAAATGCAEEVSGYPVVTGSLAAEAQERVRRQAGQP